MSTAEVLRERSRIHSLRAVRESQEIGKPPPVRSSAKRRAAIRSLRYFLEAAFPDLFYLDWAAYHLECIDKIEATVTEGGAHAFAMPRGSGKTTISECATLWAVLTGRVQYAVLIGASEAAAGERMANIKMHLERNEWLLDHFPHTIHPIRCLEGEARRTTGQRCGGVRTRIDWKADRIALPWVENRHCLCPGAVIQSYGITSAIRGMSHTRPDGAKIRPSLAICDDPQTRESAESPAQSAKRERTMAGDVAYLNGPDQAMALVMPCTVIAEGDMADNLLNRSKHPEFQGKRSRMVETFPDNLKLWGEYADILHHELRNDGDPSKATKFYKRHRKAMDRGASVTWPERMAKAELSAIQHAMNLKIRDEDSFFAEMQNEPRLPEAADLPRLSADQIAAKVGGYDRGIVPHDCEKLTAFVDVQSDHLWWMVCGWTLDFSGYVIDYGTYPDQRRRSVTKRDIATTLRDAHPGGDDNSALYAGLEKLTSQLCAMDWPKADETQIRVSRLLIDANWRDRTPTVTSLCRQTPFGAIVAPSYGRGITASYAPISQWAQTKKARSGPEWCPSVDKASRVVGIMFDANFWKTRLSSALSQAIGAKGGFQLFAATPSAHRMLSDHFAAEWPIRTESRGRVVFEWRTKPGADNDLWDCAVGCMVAASVERIERPEERRAPPAKRKRKKASYL